jgi:hypothetical protein
MISHSVITVAFMLSAPWLIGPFPALAFIIAWWWSREQYWEELSWREEARDTWMHVILTIFIPFIPRKKNFDFLVPAAIAIAIAGVIAIVL